MRRGNSADFDPNKLLPGEWAVSQDNEKIYMCYSAGRVMEIGSAAAIVQYIEQAEAWATGEKNGVPVSNSEPQYHNNAYYYSQQASTHATNAGTSETNAAASETAAANKVKDAEAWAAGTRNGSPVSSGDPAYHNNSKYWADQSATGVEDAEAWAKGTKNGVPVTPLDPQYNNDAKHWADAAAAIVGIGIATTSTAGIVKPDGTSITVDPDGTIHTGTNITISGKKVIVS